ncbi:MAG TPA: carbamoyl-phosphate synthase large subunit [Gemmatimonadetes bacterium]|nr:carbamoyl-phosphate synthase large subunit [Gemmatimonadota bacterium]
MPRRDDLETILILGSGPIIIGQACEFDYSGTQAVRALKEEGYRVVLVNSNPATIMTDPDIADRTYIEPITALWVEKVIEREKPDALLPTMGGQTALNVAMELHRSGVLGKHGVELIGAGERSIEMAEDREQFTKAMHRIGLEVPTGGFASTVEEAMEIVEDTGYPAIVRPSYTLGGTGGGISYNSEEFREQVRKGLDASPITEVLIDRSVIGWKEYELEVVRDAIDNVIIVCSIENFDPMGVHTGDSITVAPAQTLTDVEYQKMRDASIAIIREIGVEAGGCNVQFAINPEDGEMLVVEMNPRVSRSSALASKATGFPIARVGAKLAVGYHLHELPNDITKTTPASFEPVLDYVVVKLPRFAFEKFPEVDDTLGIEMKSVGETMAIGRTFRSAWQKGFRGLETGRHGWVTGPGLKDDGLEADDRKALLRAIRRPTANRPFQLRRALEAGLSAEDLFQATKIDPWFIDQLQQILDWEARYREAEEVSPALLRRMKREGFSDLQLAELRGEPEAAVRTRRWALNIRPTYNVVDTCAGEFPAETPYYYSSYEDENESVPSQRQKVVILGSGPNRIGQGIEFDYCCVQAVLALKEAGFETIMINSNPETVSTDFDVSDKLYFEPLTLEDVLEILHLEKPMGVIVQLGGQTPLKLAHGLEEFGAPVLGTSVEAIDRAEDRDRFDEVCKKIGARTPANGIARSEQEALDAAREIGFPVLVRPSYVLGGRAMRIIYDEASLAGYFVEAAQASEDHPVLVDRFLEDAFEADVDALCDGTDVVIGGIMQHIEDAGVHSGDSACVLPPYLLSGPVLEEIRDLTRKFALELGVIGLMNVQYAVKAGEVYVIEVNPRASRTVPFVSKAIGVPLAGHAAKIMCGMTLEELGFTKEVTPPYFCVKSPVFPFNKFPGIDITLSPEMRSTGEVMGIDPELGNAFVKAHEAAGIKLPMRGRILLTVKHSDKRAIIGEARTLASFGYELLATDGTYRALKSNGIEVIRVNKVTEGRPHIVDLVKNREIDMILNTPYGKQQRVDDSAIRSAAVSAGIPCITTLAGIRAVVSALAALQRGPYQVRSLQEYHKEL